MSNKKLAQIGLILSVLGIILTAASLIIGYAAV